MKTLSGSYKSLFGSYILEENTFLKRPVVVIGNKMFEGSERKPLKL